MYFTIIQKQFTNKIFKKTAVKSGTSILNAIYAGGPFFPIVRMVKFLTIPDVER